MNLKSITVQFENMDEFRELLQKASDQSEQLSETLEQIESFELKVVQDKAAAATEACTTNQKCVVCHEYSATLQNDDNSWICEDCAQHVSDLGHELSMNN